MTVKKPSPWDCSSKLASQKPLLPETFCVRLNRVSARRKKPLRLLAGYHRRPSATAEATRSFSGVDWFTHGDLGRLDPNGYLHLVDRKTNMIISGGENIYPAEVENVLAKHPAIHDVAVLGLPDSRWGQQLLREHQGELDPVPEQGLEG